MNYNDVNFIYKLISKSFSSFFIEGETKAIDSKNYFSFEGVSKEQIEQLYASTSIKDDFDFEMNAEEVFILLSVIAPFYYPDVYRGAVFLRNINEGAFASLGGKILGDNKCFYPTGETILFLLSGHNFNKRNCFESYLMGGSRLMSGNLLSLGSVEVGASQLSGQLYPSAELLSILNGKVYRPEYSTNFPAARLETRMEWDDLVLPYDTHEALEELRVWMEHGQKLIDHVELGRKIKPGYKTLFYGPPGTGKTLTASLIGKTFGVDVYRIDLSMVVSKWVGETEKNLKGIFDQATDKNWILFFDEADSLFGKRSSTNSSNDRYANQEVSYLLQRIEDFPGLVILASNLKSNIDEAFNRRFQSAILFPMPDIETRYMLWKKAFPSDFSLSTDIDLHAIAEKYELAGGAIINIVRFCVLMALKRANKIIELDDIEHAIIREFKKEGKIVS